MANLPNEIQRRSPRKGSLFQELFQILQRKKANLLLKEEESSQQLKKFESNIEFNATMKNKQQEKKITGNPGFSDLPTALE